MYKQLRVAAVVELSTHQIPDIQAKPPSYDSRYDYKSRSLIISSKIFEFK
jgi:hypothetical protein